MQIDPFLYLCTKLKSKWIKNLHIKPETLKLIEEKVGKSLEDMGTGKNVKNEKCTMKHLEYGEKTEIKENEKYTL